MHPRIVEAGRQLTEVVCGRRATLLGNVDRLDRKPRCGAELTKRQDVERPGIRGRGNNRNTAPECFGLMGVALAAAKAPERPFPSDCTSILLHWQINRTQWLAG
jgi:hypothetical protein